MRPIASIAAFALATAMMLAPGSSTLARVHEQADAGFVLRHAADVPASAEQAWQLLVSPARWWRPVNTYSGDAANLSLDPRAGGCFCEIMPSLTSPRAAPRGSAEHMHVVYVEQPRALRMTGALGPLQSGAATGTLTIMLKPQGQGTRIMWEYVYGGYVRGDARVMAEAIDAMLGAQLAGLAQGLGAVPASPSALPPAREDTFAREMAGGLEEPEPAPVRDLPGGYQLPPGPPARASEPGYVGR